MGNIFCIFNKMKIMPLRNSALSIKSICDSISSNNIKLCNSMLSIKSICDSISSNNISLCDSVLSIKSMHDSISSNNMLYNSFDKKNKSISDLQNIDKGVQFIRFASASASQIEGNLFNVSPNNKKYIIDNIDETKHIQNLQDDNKINNRINKLLKTNKLRDILVGNDTNNIDFFSIESFADKDYFN